MCPSCGTIHYENPSPAATVIGVQGDQLLLVKRAVEPAVGQWCLPGGFMERGEVPEQTARRELHEETGLEAGALTFLDFCPYPSGPDGVLVLAYHTAELKGQIVPGDDAAEARYFPLADLPPVAFPCHRALIEIFLSRER